MGDLWIQEKVEDGELLMSKIDGTMNPADAMTKNLSAGKIVELLDIVGQEARDSRAQSSLHI